MSKHYPARCAQCGVPKGACDFPARDDRKAGAKRRSLCDGCLHADYRKRTRESQRRARAVRNPVFLANERRHSDKVRKRIADETRRDANNAGKLWTSAELEVVARRELSARTVAGKLGRSYESVKHKRRALLHDPKTARLAGIDSTLADLAAPVTINIAPRYEG